MNFRAVLLGWEGGAAVAATLIAFSGCGHVAPAAPERPDATAPPRPDALVQSSRRIVGTLLATDLPRGFAFVDLVADPPAGALADGVELIVRTLELQETGRLRVSRFVRGRTLGAKIVAGQPSPGDEVVWEAR